MAWLLWGLAAAIVILLLWLKIKGWLPSTTSPGVIAALDKAADYTTDAVTAGAFQTLALAAWVNSDTAFILKLAECKAMQKEWGVKPVVPVAPTVAVQTTEGQVIQVARATNIVVETTP